jgi:hypothetical protein
MTMTGAGAAAGATMTIDPARVGAVGETEVIAPARGWLLRSKTFVAALRE